MAEIINSPTLSNNDNYLSIKDLLMLCLRKWKWFVLSLVITCGAGVLYLMRTPAVYTRSASILLKEDGKGQSIGGDIDFAAMGLIQSNTNINNEILTLTSPATIQEVVGRLALHTSYNEDGRFHSQVLYGTTLPLRVTFRTSLENVPSGFTVTTGEAGSVILSNFTLDGDDLDDNQIEAVVGHEVQTPVGELVLTATPFYAEGREVHVTRLPVSAAVRYYSSCISVAKADEKASVITLTVKDESTQRADDILNTLIAVYNDNWVKDRNQIAVSTSAFIDDRLRVIEQELGVVEGDISSYKSSNLISDLQSASDMYLQQSSQLNAEIITINNSLYMARYIKDYVLKEENSNQLLPAGTGLEGSSLDGQISEYNTILLQRNNLVANSSESNPLVADLDHSLAAMREAIVGSLDNYTVLMQTRLSALQGQERQATDRIASTPDQAKYLLSVERQQKVKEALYLFLLQKREENELSQAFTAYNTRVINPPSGSSVPTSPQRGKILVIAFALGLIIPAASLFLMEMSNTRIRGRKDIEGLSLPFAGEIPDSEPRKGTVAKILARLKKQHGGKERNVPQIVVSAGRRDVVNEAFRVMRTNLEFMCGKEAGCQTVLVTSFNPGSGKTYITLNLAMTLAIKNKRVLVIDGDLRKRTASYSVGNQHAGLSDYLAGVVQGWQELIVPHADCNTLHVLPVGTVPPNPTELISDGRMGSLLEELKSLYDYILIDCPPINIVADTQILGQMADRTLFIVRAGLLEREMLDELQRIYASKQFRNMATVLNGTEGGGRYGYRYGYSYGYGRSYGYGYGN